MLPTTAANGAQILTNPAADAQGRANYRMAVVNNELVRSTFQTSYRTERRLSVPAQLPVFVQLVDLDIRAGGSRSETRRSRRVLRNRTWPYTAGLPTLHSHPCIAGRFCSSSSASSSAAGRAQVLLGDDAKPTLILISFDGWRWDYRTTYAAPNLTRLAARGVSADLIPSYPSKTFPNHYTIVTGLYPGHHGIVANTVKDLPTGRRLSMSNSVENRDAMWWGGEPIWVTVQRAGLLSASMFWVGIRSTRSRAIGRTSGRRSTMRCPALHASIASSAGWIYRPPSGRPS